MVWTDSYASVGVTVSTNFGFGYLSMVSLRFVLCLQSENTYLGQEKAMSGLWSDQMKNEMQKNASSTGLLVLLLHEKGLGVFGMLMDMNMLICLILVE